VLKGLLKRCEVKCICYLYSDCISLINNTRECVTKRNKSNTRPSSCPPRCVVPTNSSPRLGITYSSPFGNTLGDTLCSRDSKINPGFCWQNPTIYEELGSHNIRKVGAGNSGERLPNFLHFHPIQHKIPQTPRFSATETQLLQEELENLL